MEESKRAQEVLEAQVTKQAREARLQLEVEEILQATREAICAELEVEWAKFKTQQVEKGPSTLSINAMGEAIKVLQDLVVS
jgi:hypothetical protein